MAKIVQTLTRASEEYDQDISQSLVPKPLTTF